VPPLLVATTGRFMAIASAKTRPNGSSCDGNAKTSDAAISAGMSGR
jgi:hypothetical protein